MYVSPIKPNYVVRNGTLGRAIGDDATDCSCFSGHVIGFLLGAVAILGMQEFLRQSPRRSST